jgi:hypothetical protein
VREFGKYVRSALLRGIVYRHSGHDGLARGTMAWPQPAASSSGAVGWALRPNGGVVPKPALKRVLVILTLGLTLAAASYTGGFCFAMAPARAELCAPVPELAWLSREFKMDDEQVARIRALHEAYVTESSQRCRQSTSKNAALREQIAKTGEITPEIEKGMNEIAQLRAECQKAMFRHFMAVSRAMPPEQGRRYLSWVLQQTIPCQLTGSNAACPVMMK